MASAGSLPSLPPELLLRISAYLTTPELGHFRMTCKHVEAHLFDSFAKEFFTKRQFMIEHPSLQALVDIANHPTLAKFLSEVIISTHNLERFYQPEWEIALIQKLYDERYLTRETLLNTGQAKAMLVDALSKLPNLKTIGLRDYEGRGRFRDGEDASWRSYHWSYGRDPDDHASRKLSRCSPGSILALLLSALGEAQAAPSNFEVFLRKKPMLTPISFHLVDGTLGQSIKPVLAGLKRLMLAIDNGDPLDLGAGPTLRDGSRHVPLQRFLEHTPNLHTLRLNFEPAKALAESTVEWLGETTPKLPTVASSTLSVPVATFSTLRSLELGMLIVNAPTLAKAIAKFNLTSVSLWKVTLKCQDKAQLTIDPSRWSIFLDTMSKALPTSNRIKHFAIGYPTQGTEGDNNVPCRVDVVFGADGDPEKRKTTDVSPSVTYRAGYGSNVKHWLADLATRVWAAMETLENGDDESDADEMEDEDEDDGEDGESSAEEGAHSDT